MIHTVKGFGIVNKAEIGVFLELSCIFDDPADVDNLISGSSALFNLLYIKIFSGFNSITGISILKSLKSIQNLTSYRLPMTALTFSSYTKSIVNGSQFKLKSNAIFHAEK